MNECSSKETTSKENQREDGGENRGVGRLQGLMARWQTLKTCKCQGVEQKKMPRTWTTRQLTQLNAAQERDLHSRQRDSPKLTVEKEREVPVSTGHTFQLHNCAKPFSSLPFLTPPQGNWKEKKQNTPLARPDCSSGRGVSKSPPNGTGMKYHNPGLSVPLATRWETSQGPGLSFPICQRRRAKEEDWMLRCSSPSPQVRESRDSKSPGRLEVSSRGRRQRLGCPGQLTGGRWGPTVASAAQGAPRHRSNAEGHAFAARPHSLTLLGRRSTPRPRLHSRRVRGRPGTPHPPPQYLPQAHGPPRSRTCYLGPPPLAPPPNRPRGGRNGGGEGRLRASQSHPEIRFCARSDWVFL